MSAWNGWVSDVLAGIGAPVNDQNARFVNAWGQCEQSGASYNPLNTTQPAKGATNYNSVGVKNYPDQKTGLRATVDTLTNGYYSGLVRDLRAGTYTGAELVNRNASQIATWGTQASCIAGQFGSTVSAPSGSGGGLHGPTGQAAGTTTHRHVVPVPHGPSGPTGATKETLPGAFRQLVSALATTIPTRAKYANRASRQFHKAVR